MTTVDARPKNPFAYPFVKKEFIHSKAFLQHFFGAEGAPHKNLFPFAKKRCFVYYSSRQPVPAV